MGYLKYQNYLFKLLKELFINFYKTSYIIVNPPILYYIQAVLCCMSNDRSFIIFLMYFALFEAQKFFIDCIYKLSILCQNSYLNFIIFYNLEIIQY